MQAPPIGVPPEHERAVVGLHVAGVAVALSWFHVLPVREPTPALGTLAARSKHVPDSPALPPLSAAFHAVETPGMCQDLAFFHENSMPKLSYSDKKNEEKHTSLRAQYLLSIWS